MAGLDDAYSPVDGLTKDELIGMLDKSVGETANLQHDYDLAMMELDTARKRIVELNEERDRLLMRLAQHEGRPVQ